MYKNAGGTPIFEPNGDIMLTIRWGPLEVERAKILCTVTLKETGSKIIRWRKCSNAFSISNCDHNWQIINEDASDIVFNEKPGQIETIQTQMLFETTATGPSCLGYRPNCRLLDSITD